MPLVRRGRRRRTRQISGLLLWMALLGVVACARVRPLSGGPADETPPALLHAAPGDSSTGLDRNTTFHYQFSERLDRNSVRAALRTYPHQVRRDISVKGGRVTLHFPDSLPADTTFVVVFGEDLQDQKPRDNRLQNELWFVYSTADTLRDGALYGRISLKGVPEPDGAVQFEPLHPDTSASSRQTRYPFAAADAEGLFRMFGIPSGQRFLLHGFADRNHNRLIDENELQAVYPETLQLAAGQTLRGLQWNLIDPNEKGSVSGVVINRSGIEGRVAVALRLLRPYAGSDSTRAEGGVQPGRSAAPGSVRGAAPPDSAAAGAAQLPPDRVVSPLAALPQQDRQQSPYAAAYALLDSTGFEASQWRITYATPRGDYSIRVAPGHHWMVAFVDAQRDSIPGLYVAPDSTRRLWEPFSVGDTLYVAPGEEQRAGSIDLEAATPGP